jgi:tetratricopeptide (TPR) repeat protein
MVLGLLGRRKPSYAELDLKSYKDRRRASNHLAVEGEEFMAARNLEAAISCFDRAIELDTANEYAWGGKALALDYLKRYENALECYNKAIECNSNNSITWHNRGLTLASLKMLRESVESFGKALEINPNYAKAWYNKGRLLEKLGESESSQQCFNKARKLDPLLFVKLRGR